MKSVSEIKDCYGCGVCAASCGRNAISMKLNSVGFYGPNVNKQLCVDCGLCVDVCSFLKDDVEKEGILVPKFFASWSNDENIRNICSSGGVGYEIEKFLLEKKYTAIVCRYNSETGRAEHFIAQTKDELKESIGSKYIQSDAYVGFSKIERGKKYLIVGTPCQIDSARRWMKKMKMNDKVVLMDFFCHGVPSMVMWDKYLKEVEKKIGFVDNIVWRDKGNGWHDSWVMKVDNRYVSKFSQGDMFYRMFLKNRCLAKSCYEKCKFKEISSAADIRVGDLWGSKYSKNEKGVSGVVALTKIGSDLYDSMCDILCSEQTTKDVVCESQMKKSAHRPISYGYVMKNLSTRKSLEDIDRVARLLEMVEEIPNTIRYYVSRLPVKLGNVFRVVESKKR